jgi:hypothetical protein
MQALCYGHWGVYYGENPRIFEWRWGMFCCAFLLWIVVALEYCTGVIEMVAV